MGEVTGIGWTDHTWSPWWGCTRVSVGEHGACEFCYAEALDKRTGGDHWGLGKPRKQMSDKHWAAPLKWNAAVPPGETRFVFPSMCDPFDKEVPIAWLQRFFGLMEATPNLTWLLLTKRPPLILKRSVETGLPFPRNAAIGATVVTQAEFDRDVGTLLNAKALLRAPLAFLSIEPMMGPMDIRTAPRADGQGVMRPLDGRFTTIDWVICGGESGPRPRPMDPAWPRALRDQCAETGTSFFFKQWGGRTPKANGKALDGREWCERPGPSVSQEKE